MRSWYILCLLALFACRTPPVKNPAPPQPPRAIPGFAVAFSADATQALVLQNKTLSQLSLQSDAKETINLPGVESAQALDFTDGIIAAGFSNGELKIFSRAQTSLLETFRPITNPIEVVAISEDNQLLAAGYLNGTVALFDLNQKKLLFSSNERDSHKERVTALALSPNTLLSASTDRRLKLWSTSTPNLQSTLTGHSRAVWSAALSAETAFSSSDDGSIRGWSLAGTERFFRLDSAPLITLSSSGARLVAIKTNELLLLDATSGAELARLSANTPKLRAAAYHEASRTVWAISKEGQLLSWPMPEENPPETW